MGGREKVRLEKFHWSCRFCKITLQEKPGFDSFVLPAPHHSLYNLPAMLENYLHISLKVIFG